jgi:hypothetical protein
MLSAFSRPALTPMEDCNQLQLLPAYSVRNYEPGIRNDKLASPEHSTRTPHLRLFRQKVHRKRHMNPSGVQ